MNKSKIEMRIYLTGFFNVFLLFKYIIKYCYKKFFFAEHGIKDLDSLQ